MISRLLALVFLTALGSCSLEEARAGDRCARSTECADGLGCVRGRCSRDLGPIADENTVPELGDDADGGEPAADGDS
jgi:hypothetical protein